MNFTHGSLFSGIGGFDLAAEWMKWVNAFHCEINEFGQKVLKYYWPNATTYTDIKQTDFTIWRGRIDVLSGGFPCQPYSSAGKRLGKADDRHLWPEMLRAIREIQPTWVVGENVRGLTNWNGGLVFDEVQSDLEAEGYEILPFLLPACAVNAPHRRDRIWFVAYSNAAGKRRNEREGETKRDAQHLSTDTGYHGLHGSQNRQGYSERNDSNTAGADTAQQSQGCGSEATGENRVTADPNNIDRGSGAGGENGQKIDNSGTGLLANADSDQRPEGRGSKGGSIEAERYTRTRDGWFVRNTWENFPTQPPVCSGDDGLSSRLAAITVPKKRGGYRILSGKQTSGRIRNESLKAYGNAIVPQVVYQIFQGIEQYTNPHY